MNEEALRWHRDPDFFRAAVSFTAAETGFSPRLVEKDYFCTLVLRELASSGDGLAFRGGTCLAKVHAGFYRLSEDLDFLISTAAGATRATRRALAAPWKEVIAGLPDRLAALRVVAPLTGANDSRQYAAEVGYASLLGDEVGSIKVEVSLREQALDPVEAREARTLLLDPASGEPLVPIAAVPSLTRQEVMAEKLRAALTRREVAIRDFFDLDHAVRRLGFQPDAPELLALLRAKLAVPGNPPIDLSETRRRALDRQLDAQLRPVLRPRDFDEFDLERAFATVAAVARALE